MLALRVCTGMAVAAAAVVGLFVACNLTSQGAAEPPGQAKEPTAERLRQALNQKVTIDFAHLSLEDAAAKLREETKLHFVADKSPYGMAWNPQETPAGKQGGISLHVENAKLGPALKKMLGDHGLGYAILGDTILLTHQQEASRRQMEQPVTLALDQVELNAALKRLTRDTGTNIVIDSRAKKEAANTVSLAATDVALEDGVRLLANMAGLKTVRIGSVLYVTTKANAHEFQREVAEAGRAGTGTAGPPGYAAYGGMYSQVGQAAVAAPPAVGPAPAPAVPPPSP
jgi:hypothetical protein